MTSVLVVDDVPAMAEQYAYDLRRLGGYDTAVASGGAQALERLAHAHRERAEGAQADQLPSLEAAQGPLRDVMDVPGFDRYCAWIDGELVGPATLRLDDGLAQLCGAATLPAWRRRGVQTALLQRRLADAAAAGCDLALMTTSPGTKSQENGLKQGFALLYVRALMVKQ